MYFVSYPSIALIRQTDPNWEAFFFLTDEKPFEDGLKRILSGFNDSRLTFVDVPLELRPKVDGSRAVDLIFLSLLPVFFQ